MPITLFSILVIHTHLIPAKPSFPSKHKHIKTHTHDLGPFLHAIVCLWPQLLYWPKMYRKKSIITTKCMKHMKYAGTFPTTIYGHQHNNVLPSKHILLHHWTSSLTLIFACKYIHTFLTLTSIYIYIYISVENWWILNITCWQRYVY